MRSSGTGRRRIRRGSVARPGRRPGAVVLAIAGFLLLPTASPGGPIEGPARSPVGAVDPGRSFAAPPTAAALNDPPTVAARAAAGTSGPPPFAPVDPGLARSPVGAGPPGAGRPVPRLAPTLPDGPQVPPPRSRPDAPPPNLTLTGDDLMVIGTDTAVGTVTISGSAALIVENGTGRPTLTVNGNIVLSGDALLYVNASVLAINESYNVEWSITASGDAVFAVGDGNVTTNGFQWGGLLEGNANLTAIDSVVGYPSGWIDTTLVQNASLFLALAYYLSDVVLFDVPSAPSTARFDAIDSIGFNVWLNFKNGTRATLSLPGTEGWRNWSFPGAATVSGTNYTVSISDCYVQVFAVMLWQGAALTLENSPDVAVALNLEYGEVNLTGLAEAHAAATTLTTGGLDLSLRNTTVLTWNVYPFGGTAAIYRSQVGEVQVYDDGNATVDQSNLTGHGGYYGEQGSGYLRITDSTIASEIVGTAGSVQLVDCTVAAPASSEVLAAGSGTVVSTDTELAAGVAYRALQGGVVEVHWSLTVNVSEDGVGVPNATVQLLGPWPAGVTTVGATDALGSWTGAPTASVLTASGTVIERYNLTASQNTSGAGVALPPLEAPTWVPLSIQPLIAGTVPTDGATGIGPTANVSIEFTFPMNEASVEGSLYPSPPYPYTPGWSDGGRNLTLVPELALENGTRYTLILDAGATTAGGVPLAVTFELTYRTGGVAPGAPPTVVGTFPAEGAQDVALNVTVVVQFSVPMSPGSLGSAVEVGPTPTSGSVEASGDLLAWVPSANLSGSSQYTLVVTTAARSAAGVALADPFFLHFGTAASPSTVGGPRGHSPANNSSALGPPPAGFPWPLYGAIAGAGVAVVLAALLISRRRRPPAPAPPRPAPGAPYRGAPPDEVLWDES